MLRPNMPPFSAAGERGAAEAPSPISSRPPAPAQQQQQQMGEVGRSGSQEHDGAAGEEGERGASSAGNRWPRQETLALLKIRSEMDAAFREAALKGPLWDQVSRRLAEMGYSRSAKKCREKFENVDKYYKRTKDGRAGRGDGKAYRFFSELEALHGHPPTPPVSLAPSPVAVAPPASAARVHAQHPPPPPATDAAPAPCVVTMGDVVGSFSLGSEGSDGEDTVETAEGGKRKRRGGAGEAMRLFEGMMRQVLERQQAMQQRLIDAIERRDQERMIREEAWRRQEVARLARDHEALAKDRAVTASRDAALISFIQRVTGHTVPLPPIATGASSLTPRPLQPTPVASAAPPPQQQQQKTTSSHSHIMPVTPQPQPPHAQLESKDLVVRAPEPQETVVGFARGGGAPSPSRWPKAEVHALIQLRTELETRYQETGPKGPLWEDISAGMRRLGYSRSAKRCKEKWENINKYFKKVKESNKKRPEDSKTCPYYHQLEALYRTKAALASSAAAPPRPEAPAVTVLAAVPLSQTGPAHVGHAGNDCINGNGNGCASRDNGGSSGPMQMNSKTGAGNGSVAARFAGVEDASGNGVATNKQQGLKQEGAAATALAAAAAEQYRQQPAAMKSSYGNDRMEEMDSDSMDEDDDEEFDDDDGIGGGEMQVQYDIHFQRQHQHNGQSVVRPNSGGGNPPATGPAAPPGTAAAAAAAAATSGASFLAMVQ